MLPFTAFPRPLYVIISSHVLRRTPLIYQLTDIIGNAIAYHECLPPLVLVHCPFVIRLPSLRHRFAIAVRRDYWGASPSIGLRRHHTPLAEDAFVFATLNRHRLPCYREFLRICLRRCL